MAKHHNFKSFKERVNALKIRPYSKLGVRSYEDTTTSFYLETLAHWKEVNISGNFTSCVERIEPFSRSLAQVLHHKNQLYDILEYHISQHDIHSLQPLLEILTQFIHDLGPEFLTFYKRFIHLLMDLCLSVSPNDSQSMKNSANILEWCFNSLAFAFRYLSPDICEDLWNSFEDLIPLLKEQKKAYIGQDDEPEAQFATCSTMFALLWTLLVRNSEANTAAMLLSQLWDTLPSTFSVLQLSVLEIVKDLKHEAPYRLRLTDAFNNEIDESHDLLKLAIPITLKDNILDSIATAVKDEKSELNDIKWRCNILRLQSVKSADDQKVALKLINSINQRWDTPDTSELNGQLISFFVNCPEGDDTIPLAKDLTDMLPSLINVCCKSEVFLSAVQNFYKFFGGPSFAAPLQAACLGNLSSTNRRLRLESIQTLQILCPEHKDILSQMTSVDQIALEVENASLMRLRISELFKAYSMHSGTSLIQIGMAHFIMGLLCKQYQPCWEAVFDALKSMADSALDDLLSRLLYDQLLAKPSIERPLKFDEEEANQGSDFWILENDDGIFKSLFKKVNDRVPHSTKELVTRINKMGVVEEVSDQITSQMRNRFLKCLKEVPKIALADVDRSLELIHCVVYDESENSWSMEEKVTALELVSSIKGRISRCSRITLSSTLREAIGSKHSKLQEAALKAYLALDTSLLRYRDELMNLLDDKLFKDEVLSLLGETSDERVKEEDEKTVIPLILQLFFGKMQTSSKKSKKFGARFTIASILPSLKPQYVTHFVSHMSSKIPFQTYFAAASSPEDYFDNIKIMTGFVNMLSEVYDALGYKEDLQYIKFLAMLVDSLLSNLPRILESSKNRDVLSRCATLLLLLVEGQFLSQEYDKTMFIHASCKALQKSSFFVRSEDKVSLLISIASMMESMACDEKVEYELTLMSSKMLRFSKDSRIRKSITKVFDAYSILRPDFRKTVEILDHLNASQSQSGDYDFSRILDGFDLIDETFFTHSSSMGWKLALSSCLFFMDNEDESVLRSNATHAIKKFAEFHSRAETDSNKTAFREVFDELINPAICHGLSNPTDDVRSSYIEVLADLARFKDFVIRKEHLQNGSKFLQGFPQHDEEFNNFVVNSVVQPIRKTLSIRNDSTICMRLPLLEACVVALLMTPSQIVSSELPGILISTCQVLRSKSQELRDHARKALCKASNHLGATYLRYLLRELRGALSRGSQIHVLSYTLNSILREVCCTAKYGDIDESARIVVDIVMEDVFGAAGKEKDAEGYHSKMIEVKAKKSFDTIELLCSKLSFDAFDSILDPMKELLDQALPSKTERAIEECFRRICLGILANERADSTDVLLLCYKIHKSSSDVKSANQCKTPKRDESHFLVDINSKSRMNNANEFQRSQYLQRLSFEILRSVIGKHRQLLSVANIDGFIPLLSTSLNSSNEPLVATVLRVVVLLIKLEFPPSRDDVFEGICEKAIEIVLESQSTAEELSQLSLKYIATVVKHWKSECCSKEAICALLLKITPDLEDPEKQSSAFNFVKAVITRRIQIPEVYDVMDKILRIMVVNHFQEIRDIARGLYFKFMLLYDQGQKRMEASFKFLMDNLKYPTPSGRQSVMELMHSILLKSNTSIVDKNASSFFVGLANLMVSDEQEKCREMATILLGQLLEKASPDKLKVFEHLIDTWLHNQDKNVLRRCGLLSYKCYISKFGMERNEILNSSASEVIELFLSFAQTSNSSEGRWEDIFSALNVSSHIIGITSKNYWEKKTKFWDLVCQCLLYPHSWIRLLSSKLLGTYVDWATESSSDKNNEFLQLVSHRSIRQLAAPGLPDSLGKASVHNILKIFSFFEDNDVLYVSDTSMTDANDREKFQHNFAADIISDRINYLLRRCVSSEFGLSSRKAILTLTTTLIGKLTGERLQNFVQQVITTLLGVDEYLFAEDTMFQEYSRECFRIAEKNLGTKLYSKVFATAKAEISTRRAKRKAERAQLMLDNPTKASEKKMKKHARFREKRKDNKDENGYYKQKRRKV
ncbi:uncharacterized protein CXQ87_004795 [Candidozyma duobushaemuli]|uniref:U3 small nucleolar RNA-associated protein 20 n=1 Tax=Candidozyma duobushaemuli TaxID=1231522 RepID=A0A2V1AFJ8_9ASCO|nr:uncharacterized protein CXQ87_004795 [[Candida] duobushaemulonis]PVH16502.1 hypothetical protein CXQ87_004795 [[Candida] duobushaemulonis]